MATNTLESSHMAKPHGLPDLVIDKILQLLPTKAAFQVIFPSQQWRWHGVVSTFPTLNFNEQDDFDRHNLNRYGQYPHQHERFINFLNGYLDFRDQYGQRELLHELSLHLRMYEARDSSIITKWLTYACHRGLKELDICPRQYMNNMITHWLLLNNHHMYCIPWKVIASANSLTSLKLEFVEVPFLSLPYVPNEVHKPLFPSLKTLSFNTARFPTDQALDIVLLECPSIEYLSLTECMIQNSKCFIHCSSLKSLEVKYCWLDDIRVDQALSLESFTFVSLPLHGTSYFRKMILNNAFNLKYINIEVDGLTFLEEFSLLGCHRELEATIIAPYMDHFNFFDGCLDVSVSVEAFEATISVRELLDQECFSSFTTHFPRLMSFLQRFRGCWNINLYNEDVQGLIVPEHLKECSSPPLPRTAKLEVCMPNPPQVRSRDYCELENSLRWIAPSADIVIKKVNVEADRKKVYKRARPWDIDE